VYRRAFTWPLALACVAGAVVALADLQTPLRPLLVSMFLLVVPGAAVVGLLRERDPLAALAVGAAASLALNVLLAQAMLLFGVWSPRAGVATVAVLGGFLYVLRVLYRTP
jgi:O-antigen/teichoic acid export membrane protein